MAEIFLLSDHHFNHANIIKFAGRDGNLIRPGFESIEHMNETIIENHNKVVKPGDKVYFGGDMGKRFGDFLHRMNGRKRLIQGNHDDKLSRGELASFDKILSWRFFGHLSKNMVVSHYPLHPMSFTYRGTPRDAETMGTAEPNCWNVHGHIHEKLVKLDNGHVDTRYFNISCEHMNYTPIHIEDLINKLGKPQPLRNE